MYIYICIKLPSVLFIFRGLGNFLVLENLMRKKKEKMVVISLFTYISSNIYIYSNSFLQ